MLVKTGYPELVIESQKGNSASLDQLSLKMQLHFRKKKQNADVTELECLIIAK